MIGLSPSGLGRFRVVFGVALLGALLLNPLPELALARDLHRYSELSDWAWAHWLAEHPFPGTITFVTAVALLTFASGVWPRTAFLASAITLTVYVMTLLQYGSEHDWGLPLVVLWGLTLAPWHSTGKGTGTEGFAIWLPGFALGLAWLAAAVSKFMESGVGWITTGAAKYHFLVDAHDAPTDWDLWVASHPTAAVIVSLGAVVLKGHSFFMPSRIDGPRG